MAKMFYSLEETLSKLGCNEDQLRTMVRNGNLREFRDAGKLNYKVEEVDALVAKQGTLGGSGELSLEDSGTAAPLTLLDSSSGSSVGGPPPKAGRGGSDAPIDLSGSSGELRLDDSRQATPAPSASGSGPLGLGGSGELRLEDTGTSDLKLEDSRGSSDAISLDEVDKDQVGGPKKDDTVITNIGISVFDEEDLQIAADPMAKTMLTGGGEDHLGLGGSAGGSGLLELTRESDDTSLGAELLDGIDMGDTGDAPSPVAARAAGAKPATGDTGAGVEALPEAEMPGPLPIGQTRMAPVAYVEAASPMYAGALAAAAIAMVLLGATAVATSMGAWPAYLSLLADQDWYVTIGAMIGLGLLATGIGYLVGMKASAPSRPSKLKAKVKPAKGKKGAPEVAAPAEPPPDDDIEALMPK